MQSAAESPQRFAASTNFYFVQRRKISEPFVPPKPKEFDNAYIDLRLNRRLLGT